MIDGAVIIAAQEMGLFAKHGICVALSRELGWATIREKILHEELDAAHAPASMAFAMRCGIGMVSRPCLTGMVLSLNGSAITLSNELWEKGVHDAESLRLLIEHDRDKRVYSFGAVMELSSQHYNLRNWLRAGGIDPDRDVRIPIVPSPLLHHGLLDGHLDGYCVAEPWNSIVTQQGAGWVVATASEIDNGMPEKVLLVLEKFAENRQAEHLAMIAALIEASVFCENPANRMELIRMLALPRYLDVPESLLKDSLIGPFHAGREDREIADFIVFHRDGANIPNREKGRRIFNEVRSMNAAKDNRALRPDVINRIFREDIYQQAKELMVLKESPTPNSQPPGSKTIKRSPAAKAAAKPDLPSNLHLSLAG